VRERQILRHAQHGARGDPPVLLEHEGRLEIVVEGHHPLAEEAKIGRGRLPVEVDQDPLHDRPFTT
jgi:hypothetical protein